MDDASPRYSKRLRSGTRRRYQDDGISDDEIDGKRSFNLEDKLHSKKFNSALVKNMEGKDFTFEYIQREGLRDPIIFEKPDGLGIEMPNPDFSVNDVKLFVGSRRLVDVMDVTTQKGIEMSMAQWRRYYETPASEREKLYNVISLEFSHTKLENLVKRPASVDIIDWVDNMWPRHLKERQRDSTNAIIEMQYPKVQKYCLMSVEGCFTDFHIDFGGTSVWYHVLRGGKVFWLIPPTSENLELYENWVLSGKQGDIFLGDKASQCQRIELKQGYTFLIPSGWIHAVYTPVDTLVFGGNFLHSFNIPMQLNIYNIEDRTRVPSKFRYPFYYEMCWYVLERYLYCLTNVSHLTPEFQKHSLGIGLKREDMQWPENGYIKEEPKEEEAPEEEEEDPIPPASKPGVKVHLTQFEIEGLWNLLGKLESLPSHKKCVPSGIHNAPALLNGFRAMLEEHANDDPKLSYTGIPIVKWPKRPSWYQPPPPPPTVLNKPRLLSTLPNSLVSSRPVKPSSSISALRRRRVRCKRCAACVRRECGDCHYCKDMRKFGGPGRLKQTCLLRQCLAPVLPSSVVCSVCGEGGQDPSETPVFALTLMECSNCAQIAHPPCIKVPGKGVVNKDLPSCWECPKCTFEKDEANSDSSGSDSSKSLASSLSALARRSHRVCLRQGDEEAGVKTTRRGRPPLALSPLSQARARRMAPPPSQRLLLQQQQHNRKRAGALEMRLKKRIKIERDKIFQAKRKSSSASLDSRSTKLFRHCSGQPSHIRGSSLRSRLSRGSSLMFRLRGLSYRRGLPLMGVKSERDRCGDKGRPEGGMMCVRRPREEREQSNGICDAPGENRVDKGKEESTMQGGSLDKENRPQCPQQGQDEDTENGTRASDEDDEEGDEDGDEEEAPQVSSGQETPVLLVSAKARRDRGAIVPKLEARGANGKEHVQHKHPQLKNGISGLHHRSSTHSTSERRKEQPVVRAGGIADAAGSTSTSSSLPLSTLSSGGAEPGCEKEVWVSVFRYLTRKELCVCMTVCKNWYKWSCDKRLWTRIDLSRCRSISPQALSGVIKRQPVSLDLSWTPISKKQLTWLVNRLPGLKDLVLSGCSWSSVSALSSPSCPPLRTLDLCWTEGVKDVQIRDLLSPPGCNNRSKLRNLLSFRLSGLEISDSTLRLIIRHMPLLTHLDLSHCRGVTDQSINLLTAVGSSTRNTLTDINLAGCCKLTDTCLQYLKRVSSISVLDLRGCKGMTRKACENFISEVSVNCLYCLSEDKLIQRIS